MDPISQLRVPGKSKHDGMKLKKAVDPAAVQLEQESLHRGEHGELATTVVVVVLARPVIKALALWLLQTVSKKSFVHKVVVIEQDGTRHEETIEYHESSAEAPFPSVVKQIGKICRIERDIIEDILNQESSE